MKTKLVSMVTEEAVISPGERLINAIYHGNHEEMIRLAATVNDAELQEVFDDLLAHKGGIYYLDRIGKIVSDYYGHDSFQLQRITLALANSFRFVEPNLQYKIKDYYNALIDYCNRLRAQYADRLGNVAYAVAASDNDEAVKHLFVIVGKLESPHDKAEIVFQLLENRNVNSQMVSYVDTEAAAGDYRSFFLMLYHPLAYGHERQEIITSALIQNMQNREFVKAVTERVGEINRIGLPWSTQIIDSITIVKGIIDTMSGMQFEQQEQFRLYLKLLATMVGFLYYPGENHIYTRDDLNRYRDKVQELRSRFNQVDVDAELNSCISVLLDESNNQVLDELREVYKDRPDMYAVAAESITKARKRTMSILTEAGILKNGR